jgi:hypothetical protein
MIAKLVNEPEWTILPEHDRIFKNRVRFRVGCDIIYMMSHLRYLEVAILPELSGKAADVCYSVRQVFENTLKEVTIDMNYNFLGGHEYAFWCNDGRCVDKKRHLTVVKDPSAFIECCQDKAVMGRLNPHQKVWFSKEFECKCMRVHD